MMMRKRHELGKKVLDNLTLSEKSKPFESLREQRILFHLEQAVCVRSCGGKCLDS